MNPFVLHSSSGEIRRETCSAAEWLQLINEIHSKGFCSTFSLTSAEVFDTEYKKSVSPHHSVGPTLEFASVGKLTESNDWENAGWLCTLINSSIDIFSYRGSQGPPQLGEYSIYTGVHIVESNCICTTEKFTPVLTTFLDEREIEIDEHWLSFYNVFMTHSDFKARQNGG